MTDHIVSPRLNLEGFQAIQFSYDRDDDIALVHLDAPRPAMTTELEDGWHLRTADGEIVGLELHGLKRTFLSTPFFAAVFTPAIEEIEAATGRKFFDRDGGDIHAEGPTGAFPRLTHLMILMIGQAVAKYEALQKAQYAGQTSRAPSREPVSA